MYRLIRILFILTFLFCHEYAFGAAMQVDALWAGLFDNSGQPLASGKVYTYTAGTLASKAVWLDSAKVTPAANPVPLDSYGRATVYADGVYLFIIKDSAGVTLATIDNLTYADPTAVTTTSFTNITSTQATIASLTSPGAFFNNAAISSSTWTNGYINGAALNNVSITGLATPAANMDAATKAYVDAAVASLTAVIASYHP